MVISDDSKYVYLPNTENWKKFMDVRLFFTDYLECGGLEPLPSLNEEDKDAGDECVLHEGAEYDEDKCKRSTFEDVGVSKNTLRETLDELAKWARRTGNISGIKMPPETVDGVFTAELDSVDFYGEFMDSFIDILGKVSSLSFRNSGNDTVLIYICVKDVWEAVESNE